MMVDVETVTPDNKRKKALGRPGGRPASREEILEAAERHFAERGYSAANLREIAFDAGVTQAMVKYYFGSKLDMFKEVYLQRGRSLAEERMNLLESVTHSPDFSIEDVIRAYLTPSFKLRESAQGRAFLRLQARLHAESDDIAYELRREAYDRPVRAYVSTLLNLLPDRSEEVIYRRFAQLIGIYIYIVSDMHRIEEISGVKRVLPASRISSKRSLFLPQPDFEADPITRHRPPDRLHTGISMSGAALALARDSAHTCLDRRCFQPSRATIH